MQEMAFCETISGILNQQRGESGATLLLGTQGIHAADRRAFVNPVLLSGVILCRGMLDFLGIQLARDSKPLRLIQRSPKPAGSDDVVCEDFGVPIIPLAEFRKFTAHLADGEESVAAILHLANKDVAHLTELMNPQWEIRRLGYTCQLMNYLLNGYFFGCLGIPAVELPKFEADANRPPSRPS